MGVTVIRFCSCLMQFVWRFIKLIKLQVCLISCKIMVCFFLFVGFFCLQTSHIRGEKVQGGASVQGVRAGASEEGCRC